MEKAEEVSNIFMNQNCLKRLAELYVDDVIQDVAGNVEETPEKAEEVF